MCVVQNVYEFASDGSVQCDANVKSHKQSFSGINVCECKFYRKTISRTDHKIHKIIIISFGMGKIEEWKCMVSRRGCVVCHDVREEIRSIAPVVGTHETVSCVCIGRVSICPHGKWCVWVNRPTRRLFTIWKQQNWKKMDRRWSDECWGDSRVGGNTECVLPSQFTFRDLNVTQVGWLVNVDNCIVHISSSAHNGYPLPTRR